jgi:hypothetical protein
LVLVAAERFAREFVAHLVFGVASGLAAERLAGAHFVMNLFVKKPVGTLQKSALSQR